MSNPLEDIIASLISEDQAKLMKERLILKSRLRIIDKELKALEYELKGEMDTNGIKTIESHGMRITYTPPRTYADFHDKAFAIKVIREIRKDLINDNKSGYSRLTIKEIKKK